MPRVLLVATGGTISTVRDSLTYEILRRASGKQLLSSIPGVQDICDVEVVQFADVSSIEVTPSKVMEIATILRRELKRPDLSGAVVMMGTDTMEEAAYVFDLVVGSNKPVVVTGAMRASGLLGEDGPRNLQASLLVAVDPASRGMGTMVVLNDQIHAASLVTKTHSLNPATFRSAGKGILGEIWDRTVVYHFAPRRRRHIDTKTLELNVDLIRVVLGMDGRFVRSSIQNGARAIVIETAGSGAMTQEIWRELLVALSSGTVLGITTRCPFGGPAGFLGDAPEGVFVISDLTGPKARILLMAALGLAKDDRKLLCQLMSL